MAEGHHEADYRIDKSFFEMKENDDILGASVDVHLDIEKRRDSYTLIFDCVGDLEVACDRCLDPVSEPIDTEYRVVVRYGEEYDDSRDNLLVIPESWHRLDVSGIIYDTLLLSLPLRCVHPEGECNSEMSQVLREHNPEIEETAEEEGTEA